MGLIHLYSATSTSFDHNGTPLVTAREAVVKRDEGFQLTFNIPISQNELHKRVQKEMIVSAMTPDGVNYFRIWDIEKRTTDVKVTALQLLYSLDVKQINPFGGRQYTGNSILQAFANAFKSSISPYTFSSSITTAKDFYTNEEDDTSTSHNALAILNKITDNWSGELMLNGFDVRMISKLGTKTDALLYEHKNIASFSDSSSMNGIVTRIYATATYTPERAEGAEEDPEPVVLTATVDSPLINQYAVIYEATAEYNDARTVAELRTEILKQYTEFNVDKPERTIDVDTNIVDGTAINFGDELVLKYLVHDVDEVIRCVGYEYDPISENYIGVTLGTLEKTFLTKVTEGISSSVTRQLDKLNKQIQIVQTAANGKNRVTYGPNPVPNAIEGDLWFKHPEGRPDEIELLIYQNGQWLPAPFLTDQDKLAFEQEVADYQSDTLAEIERKDTEYKEIFDAYDEKVVTIDQGIADAATKAQSALEEAGVSTDLAQTAKDLAATAEANASTAKTNAQTAIDDASAAVTSANQAKADAKTAMTDASAAVTEAGQAKEDAQTAITEAGQAVDSANTAKTNAQTALTDAQTALSTAKNADTKSGLAETAANTAKTNAQTALDNSSTAITNAADAITKAGQAETAANTAKTNAQTALDDAQSALTTAGSAKSTADALTITVNNLEGEVELKASQTEVDEISGTVSTHTTTIGQQATEIASKADKTVVDTLSGTVSDQGTLITQNATDIKSKAASSLVDTIKGTVDTHTTEISQNATDIKSKANTATVNTLTGRVDTAESNISQNATDITQRVTTTTYNTGIASKENAVLKQSTAPTHANGKLWLDTSVAPNILKRSNGTTWIKATPTTPGEVGAYSQSAGADLAGRLTTAETTITQTATDITSKADKSTVDTLAGTVSTQGTTITQHATAIESKADQTEVDTVKGTVSGHTTTLSQHATKIASKAESSLVDTIKGTVDTHTTDISQNATDISSKASATSVNALTGRVSTAESNVSQNATAISQRVTTTTYNTGLASKENAVLKQTAAPTHSNGKLWLDTSVTPNILKRSTGTTWVKATPTTASEVGAYSSGQGSALAGRVSTAETNITQTSTAITSKADKSVVDTLSGTVSTHNTTISQHATAIASKASQTEVDTVKGTVSGHTTTLSQHATAISSKAESSLVNTIKGTVDTHTTEISQNATDIASKASSTSVSSLTGRVKTAETTIGQHATAITSKANQTEVDTIKGTVSGHTTKISQNATAISARLTSSQVNSLVDGKGLAKVTYVDSQITTTASGIRTDMTRVEGKIDGLEIGGRNLVVSSTVTDGYYVGSGSIISASGSGANVTDFIKVSPNATYVFSNADAGTTSTYMGYYDINKNPIRDRGSYSQLSTAVFKTEDEEYIRISNPYIRKLKLEKGNIATDWTPSPEDTMMENDFNVFKASYEATAESLTSRLTAVDKVGGRLATAETKITQNATAISSKASTSTVNSLTGRVSTAETKITQNATAISSKASSSSVNTLTGRVSTAETTITQHATSIASKASQTEVDTIKGTVSGHTTKISQNATAISARLTSTQVNSLVDGKGLAKTTYVDSQITASADGIRADMTKVEGKIDGLEIGGRNLLKNGDFERGTDFWQESGANTRRIDEDGYSGNGLRIFSTELTTIIPRQPYTGNFYSGDSLTVSVKVKTHSGDFSNMVGRFAGTISLLFSYKQHLKDDWELYVFTTELQQDYSLSGRAFGFYGALGEFTIDELKLEKGNVVTDWTPAPEDTVMENDFTVFKNSYQSTVDSINTELSKTAKKTDLNGMVTESVLSTKNFVTAGSMTTTLASYAKTSNVPTKTQFNTLKNSYDSMVQTIGTNGNRIAQMVMTDSLFSTTVRDSIEVGGRNLVLDSSSEVAFNNEFKGFPLSISGFTDFNSDTVSVSFEAKRHASDTSNGVIAVYFRGGSPTVYFPTDVTITKTWMRYSVSMKVSSLLTSSNNNQIALHFGNNSVRGFARNIKLEKGNVSTDWSPAPEDKADQSTVTQLSNSWALTLKSGNDIKTQINASTSSLRLASKFIHLSGTSLIDNATIKSAMIDTLNVSKLTGTAAEFTTLRGKVITAGSISADRLVTGTALVNRVFASTAAITELTSKSAFITNIKAISIDVGKITGDKASFITLGFESLNSNMHLSSGAIRIQNSAGDFATMNTIPEFRSQDSAGTAAIMGKGRSHYYSGNQARFYIGSNLEGQAQYGIHIAKGQTFGIYRNSDSYGGEAAKYYNTPAGWGAVQVVEKLISLGYIPGPFATGAALIKSLNGWSSWPVLQVGEPVMYKAAVAGNSSGVETLWSMGTSSSGVTRLYSYPEYVFDYRIEVRDRARFIAKALFENSFTNNSDRRIKHDIKDTEVTALDHLDSLTFKEYKLNSNGSKVPLGLIAQDSGILRVKGVDEDDYEGIDGLLMPMLAMKGVQELHAIVKEQAEEIRQLKEIINQ